MEDGFSPAVWREDPVPDCCSGCTGCELSGRGARMIWGEGNPGADIIVVLDNPGAREDREKEEFVCGTRQTLQQAAHRAGLGENDLYITYVLKCRPLRKYDKDNARSTCLGYLDRQLEKGGYRLAFCLGDVAVRSFFSDPERSVRSTRGQWHIARGIKTYASYHPLAVRRRPNLYGLFINDWKEVARMASR